MSIETAFENYMTALDQYLIGLKSLPDRDLERLHQRVRLTRYIWQLHMYTALNARRGTQP